VMWLVILASGYFPGPPAQFLCGDQAHGSALATVGSIRVASRAPRTRRSTGWAGYGDPPMRKFLGFPWPCQMPGHPMVYEISARFLQAGWGRNRAPRPCRVRRSYRSSFAGFETKNTGDADRCPLQPLMSYKAWWMVWIHVVA